MFSRIAAVIAAGVLAVTGSTVGMASASTSQAFVHTVRISNNVDNGAHGYWAWLNFNRTVTITKTENVIRGLDTYSVALTDRGTLKTIPGAKSPKDDVRIDHAVGGTFEGSYGFTVKSTKAPSASAVASSYNYGCQLSGDGTRVNDCASMPASTGNWPALYFSDLKEQAVRGDTAVQGVTGGAWRWDYRTCAERRTDGSAGSFGDITGKRCDAQVKPTTPAVVQPACDATRGVLTIPSVRGVTYAVSVGRHSSRTWSADAHRVLPGVYKVTASAKDGYDIPRGTPRYWVLTVPAPVVCPTPTPTPTPTATASPSPTPSSTVTPAGVTPKAPTVAQSTCATEGIAYLSIPSVKGVVYSGSGGVVAEPSYAVQPGEVTVTAKAAEGYTLADGAKVSWTLTVNEPPAVCPGPAGADGVDGVDGKTVVVSGVKVPTRIDTGLGGTATK